MTRNPVNRTRSWETAHPLKNIDRVYVDLIIKNVGAPNESFTSIVEFLYEFYMAHKDEIGVSK